MHKLLIRYLDGELGEEEAREFIEELERDPELAADLQVYERIVEAGRSLGSEPAPSGFADRLMAELPHKRHTPSSRPKLTPASGPVWAAAAIVVVAFGLGRLTASLNHVAESPQTDVATPTSVFAQPVSFAAVRGETQSLRLVQVTYVPGGVGAESVSIAGTFNGWKSNATPMREKSGVWSAILVLPPGSYEYMFVEDGERWVTDPLAPQTRDDGFGGRNAVLDLGV